MMDFHLIEVFICLRYRPVKDLTNFAEPGNITLGELYTLECKSIAGHIAQTENNVPNGMFKVLGVNQRTWRKPTQTCETPYRH